MLFSRWCINLERKRRLRITISSKPNKETTSHDVARHYVTGPIRINPGTLIEQLYRNFLGVQNDYWLASCIEVDEITCETIQKWVK
jgi:hypothetical protein